MMEYFIEYKYANLPNNSYWLVRLGWSHYETQKYNYCRLYLVQNIKAHRENIKF